jgi:hypothetical protein
LRPSALLDLIVIERGIMLLSLNSSVVTIGATQSPRWGAQC